MPNLPDAHMPVTGWYNQFHRDNIHKVGRAIRPQHRILEPLMLSSLIRYVSFGFVEIDCPLPRTTQASTDEVATSIEQRRLERGAGAGILVSR